MRLSSVDDDGAAFGACDDLVTMTPGDAVGMVTERLLNVGAACIVDVCEVSTETAGTKVVAGPVTEILLILFIPKILSASVILKQPTYTPAIEFIGIAKHELPSVHDVSS